MPSKPGGTGSSGMQEGKARLYWGDDTSLEQHSVEHAQIQVIQGSYYVTFGEVRARVMPPDLVAPDDYALEIRPVARIVLHNRQAFKNIMEVLSKQLDGKGTDGRS